MRIVTHPCIRVHDHLLLVGRLVRITYPIRITTVAMWAERPRLILACRWLLGKDHGLVLIVHAVGRIATHMILTCRTLAHHLCLALLLLVVLEEVLLRLWMMLDPGGRHVRRRHDIRTFSSFLNTTNTLLLSLSVEFPSSS